MAAVAPMFVLVLSSHLVATSAVATPTVVAAVPRHWFIRTSAPDVTTLTTTVTATRVLTEIHLSSCLVPNPSLPTCPPLQGGAQQGSLHRLSSVAPPAEARLHTGHTGFAAVRPRKESPPMAEALRADSRSFSGLQSMIMQALHLPGAAPSSATPTPPLPRHPVAVDTRTVTVTRRTGGAVSTTTSTVSFALAGCVPSKMPFALDPCPEEVVPPLRTSAPHGGLPPTDAAPPAVVPQRAAVQEGQAEVTPAGEDEEAVYVPGTAFAQEAVLDGTEDLGSGY